MLHLLVLTVLPLGQPNYEASSLLALQSAARKQAQSQAQSQAPAKSSTCRCGPDCPNGGTCGSNCTCAQPRARVHQPSAQELKARREQGWQWDSREQYWYRYLVAPFQQAIVPSQQIQLRQQPQFQQAGFQGRFSSRCAGGG